MKYYISDADITAPLILIFTPPLISPADIDIARRAIDAIAPAAEVFAVHFRVVRLRSCDADGYFC